MPSRLILKLWAEERKDRGQGDDMGTWRNLELVMPGCSRVACATRRHCRVGLTARVPSPQAER